GPFVLQLALVLPDRDRHRRPPNPPMPGGACRCRACRTMTAFSHARSGDGVGEIPQPSICEAISPVAAVDTFLGGQVRRGHNNLHGHLASRSREYSKTGWCHHHQRRTLAADRCPAGSPSIGGSGGPPVAWVAERPA